MDTGGKDGAVASGTDGSVVLLILGVRGSVGVVILGAVILGVRGSVGVVILGVVIFGVGGSVVFLFLGADRAVVGLEPSGALDADRLAVPVAGTLGGIEADPEPPGGTVEPLGGAVPVEPREPPGAVLPGAVLPGAVLPGTVLPGTVPPGTVPVGAVVLVDVLVGDVVEPESELRSGPGAGVVGECWPGAGAWKRS